MNGQYLGKIRLAELELVSERIEHYFPARKCSILEIGAGSGWQARALAEKGHDISAVDVNTSTYSAKIFFQSSTIMVNTCLLSITALLLCLAQMSWNILSLWTCFCGKCNEY